MIAALLCTTVLFGGCDNTKTDQEADVASLPGSSFTDGKLPDSGVSTGQDGGSTPAPSPASGTAGEDNAPSPAPGAASKETKAAVKANTADMFTNRDSRTEYDKDSAINITLDGASASCASSLVSVDGSTVTIRAEGTYVLSGTLDDGMVIIDTDKNTKVQLVLAGVSIQNSSSAAIYIKKADKVFLTLADGTQNLLGNGGSYTSIDDNNIDAVIFSKDDLTINGSGSLTISALAGHGIVSKNDLAITGGTFAITAENHGMAGKDSIRIADGDFTITAGKDGLHASNDEDTSAGFLYIEGGNFTISSGGDGMDASSDLTIVDGNFHILAGGGKDNAGPHTENGFGGWGFSFSGNTKSNDTETSASTKGIKASNSLSILGGTFFIDSADDGFHCNGNLSIAGGIFSVATGDDGFHADDAVTISSGTIGITDSYEGIEGKTIEISGGDITLRASDDGLNAAGGNDASGFPSRRGQDMFASQEGVGITISGGSIQINADGDGIDSNGDLTVTGGTIYVDGPTNSGNGALDKNGTALISGGTVVAVGAAGMAETFDPASTQGCILQNTAGSHAGGTVVELLDASGTVLVSYTPAKSFSSVVVSDPSITVGNTYTLNVGTEVFEITMDTTSYGTGKGGFGGMGGGRRPGRDGGRKPGNPPDADGDDAGWPGNPPDTDSDRGNAGWPGNPPESDPPVQHPGTQDTPPSDSSDDSYNMDQPGTSL